MLSVVGVALAAGVSRLVTQPLQAMVKAAQAFSRGESHGALPVHRGDEVGELARSFQDMEQQISRQLAELNLSRDAMAHLAHHDALTGLPNRRMFEQRLGQVLELSRRSGLSLFPRDAQDARTLMASADAAMYRIKQGHKRRL